MFANLLKKWAGARSPQALLQEGRGSDLEPARPDGEERERTGDKGLKSIPTRRR
jgi:hypothetical protein